jgi:hypothetical protein
VRARILCVGEGLQPVSGGEELLGSFTLVAAEIATLSNYLFCALRELYGSTLSLPSGSSTQADRVLEQIYLLLLHWESPNQAVSPIHSQSA